MKRRHEGEEIEANSVEPLRIAIVGLARYGIGEPFAGGIEAHTATLARALQRSGFAVTVFAGPATAVRPDDLTVVPIVEHEPDLGGCQRVDNGDTPQRSADERIGYRRVMATIAQEDFDVVHNTSLHWMPLDSTTDRRMPPMVHALHTPPFVPLLPAHRRLRRSKPVVSAVSRSLAARWPDIATHVVHNGIDTDRWAPRAPDVVRGHALWIGRIVPEKGAHLAIDAAASSGRSLLLCGPCPDGAYFRDEIEPRLGEEVVWAGHLNGDQLVAACGSAEVGIVTPQWAEPFGLVALEMMAAGLPIAAVDRGAIREIVPPQAGSLAAPDDADALAAAIDRAAVLDRRSCTEHVRTNFSADAMVAGYVDLYLEALNR